MDMASHLKVPEDRMVFDSREQHPHGVGSVVQEGNPGSIQVTGQLMDICLQLGKGWRKEEPMRLLRGAGPGVTPTQNSWNPHPGPEGT